MSKSFKILAVSLGSVAFAFIGMPLIANSFPNFPQNQIGPLFIGLLLAPVCVVFIISFIISIFQKKPQSTVHPESPRTLKIFFILAGIFGTLEIFKLFGYSFPSINSILILINAIFGIGYLIIGIRFYELMQKHKIIVNFLAVNLLYSIGISIYSYVLYHSMLAVGLIINLLVSLYLISAVKKLALKSNNA